MRWIDGLPYYTFLEIEKMPTKHPKHVLGEHKNSEYYECWMNSYKISFFNYLGMYFENCIGAYSKSNIEIAKDRLEKSINYNIDYIKSKHCKS